MLHRLSPAPPPCQCRPQANHSMRLRPCCCGLHCHQVSTWVPLLTLSLSHPGEVPGCASLQQSPPASLCRNVPAHAVEEKRMARMADPCTQYLNCHAMRRAAFSARSAQAKNIFPAANCVTSCASCSCHHKPIRRGQADRSIPLLVFDRDMSLAAYGGLGKGGVEGGGGDGGIAGMQCQESH